MRTAVCERVIRTADVKNADRNPIDIEHSSFTLGYLTNLANGLILVHRDRSVALFAA